MARTVLSALASSSLYSQAAKTDNQLCAGLFAEQIRGAVGGEGEEGEEKRISEILQLEGRGNNATVSPVMFYEEKRGKNDCSGEIKCHGSRR